MPEVEFRRVTGITGTLKPAGGGDPADNYLCLAHAAGRSAPLGLQWDLEDAEKIVRQQERGYAERSSYLLPSELGKGFASPAAGSPRPNYVIAMFRCGDERPWLSIDFAPVVRGRDAVQDMFAFMRIAQKRFGQIHKCEPRPS
ncbi:hypothetical protein [Actinomadura miaoliensis]|uniref:hypothetical protein n=1 Tax=Actinomadura miaoliensis TaxID=430685 RepID=UPI0031EB15ED